MADREVEEFRQERRQRDRARREEGEDDTNKESSSKDEPSSNTYKSTRESRMARLRREMKDEDDELAALDEKQRHAADEAAHAEEQAALAKKPKESIIEVNQEELEGLDEEEQMRRLLGIESFGSTKGEAVADNHSSAAKGVANKNKARKYRQYMNRKNGFNRPLEKMN